MLLILAACSGGQDALRARRPAEQPDAGLDASTCQADAEPPPGDEPPSRLATPDQPHAFFQIRVVDAADQSPIAGAEVRTIHSVVYSSDRNGLIAYYEPELMAQDVYFTATRAGFEHTPDGFGYRGATLHVREGGQGKLELTRSATPPPVLPDPGDLETRLLAGPVPGPDQCFAIRVVDRQTKRGVPLAFLRNEREQLVTDSQGMAAYCNPDRLTGNSSFTVSSHGYSYQPGVLELTPRAGASVTIELSRQNVAERLFRSTGQGIYRDSTLLGLTVPADGSTLHGKVLAQDAVCAASFRGQLFWIWGFTDRPAYPLGNFLGSAARSPSSEGSYAGQPLMFSYFENNDGFSRGMTETIEPSSLPTWLSALTSVPDQQGQEQLFAVYTKPNADLSVAKRGLVQLDTERELFVDSTVSYATDALFPGGQPITFRHGELDYLYYAGALRVPARAEALRDPGQYEVWTARQGNTLLRGDDGNLLYAWRAAGQRTTMQQVSAAGLGPDQVLDGNLRDVDTGATFQTAGAGAQAFAARHGRFVRLFQQLAGISSFLGEVWYAEADTPMGPWSYARKILTHDKYTFYSPWLHPYLTPEDGRYLYFEGSYTSALAGDEVTRTPRYERNQIMYRLDLDDERLALPVPIYPGPDGPATKRELRADVPVAAAFFAPERPAPGLWPVARNGPACRPRQLVLQQPSPTPALFYAVPPDDSTRAAYLVPLHETSDPTRYDTSPSDNPPLAYVWPSTSTVAFPSADYAGSLLARAGSDQCLQESAPGRGVRVLLSAAQTVGEVARYQWRRWGESCPFAEGSEASLQLGVGLHSIELTVSDAQHGVSFDTLIVLVEPAP